MEDYKSIREFFAKLVEMSNSYAEHLKRFNEIVAGGPCNHAIQTKPKNDPCPSNTPPNKSLLEMVKEQLDVFIDSINSNPQCIEDLGEKWAIMTGRFDYDIMHYLLENIRKKEVANMVIVLISNCYDELLKHRDKSTIHEYRQEIGWDMTKAYIPKYNNIKETLISMYKEIGNDKETKQKYKSLLKKSNGKENPRPTRQHVDIKTATHSFIYKPNGLSERERNKRLITFFGELCRNGKYLDADTDANVFLKNFTGKHTAEKLLWTAQYKQLRYLISKLHMAGVLKWNSEKPKPGISQMMCIVFQIVDNDYNRVDDKFDKEKSKHIHDIEVSNLNTKIDEKDEGLDPIIRKLIIKDDDENCETIEEGVANLFSDFQT